MVISGRYVIKDEVVIWISVIEEEVVIQVSVFKDEVVIQIKRDRSSNIYKRTQG